MEAQKLHPILNFIGQFHGGHDDNLPLKLSPNSRNKQNQPAFRRNTFSNDLARDNNIHVGEQFKNKCTELSDDDEESDEEDENDEDDDEKARGESASPVSVIKDNPLVIKALRKLMELQEQKDIQRFVCRAVPAQRIPKYGQTNADCCFSGRSRRTDVLCEDNADAAEESKSTNDTDRKCNPYCRPFLSCPIKHSKSNDFEEFPDFGIHPYLKSQLDFVPTIGFNFNLHRPTKKAPPPSNPTERLKCRGCPQTSIFLPDPDHWYQDYKYQITYGRITSSQKQKLREKVQLWISSDDYKDKLANLKHRSNSMYKFQENHNVMNRRQNTKGLVGVPASSRGSIPPKDHGSSAPVQKYGPSAIASLSVFSSPKNANPNFNPVVNEAASMYHKVIDKGGLAPTLKDNSFHPDDIPWPSDNFRFYDDDTDPRLTEFLANTPFVAPSSEAANDVIDVPELPPQNQKISPIFTGGSSSRNKMLKTSFQPTKTSRPSITIDKILKPVEYVIGSGRLTKNENNQKQGRFQVPKQSASISKKPISNESGTMKINKHEIGDTSASGNELIMTTTAGMSNAGIGDGGNFKNINNLGESGRKSNKLYLPKSIHNSSKKLVSKLSDPTTQALNVKKEPLTLLVKAANSVEPKKLQKKGKSQSRKKSKTTVRRFEQNISTVSIRTPMSKAKVSILDDNNN